MTGNDIPAPGQTANVRTWIGYGRVPDALLGQPAISPGAKAMYALVDSTRGLLRPVQWYADTFGISERTARIGAAG